MDPLFYYIIYSTLGYLFKDITNVSIIKSTLSIIEESGVSSITYAQMLPLIYLVLMTRTTID